MKLITRTVAFWDRREGAESLALIRILLSAVIFFDLVQVVRLGLVVGLFATPAAGGIGSGDDAGAHFAYLDWLGQSAGGAYALVTLGMLFAFSLGIGCYSRTSAALLLLCYAQLGRLSPGADRGIDVLLRNCLLVLACSGAGETWSLDALRRHGRFDSQHAVTAWPRYLLIAQLVLLYFWAGIQKQSAAWTSIGDYAALFMVLNQPHYARFEIPYAWLNTLYPLLQASTIATLVFERSAILIPLVLWLRLTRNRGGLLRVLVVEGRVLELWIATGVLFHLALAVVAQLGIFPWGCLALYPSLVRPKFAWRAMRAALELGASSRLTAAVRS